MERLYFAGHETFYCRNYWLKKGLDHLWSNNKFDDSAIIGLGVGKNMVASVKFWLKAFGLTNESSVPQDLAIKLFDGEKGYDQYCEDIATIWLLHYFLVTRKRASIYHIVFNQFRKERTEFTREHLLHYIQRYCKKNEVNYNINSLKKDITVFISNYITPSRTKSIEDDFSGLLYELGLLHNMGRSGGWYRINNADREEIPSDIILFCILSNMSGKAISFNELLNNIDSVGSVFALTSNGLMNKINQIIEKYPNDIVFTDDGGIRVLQFKKPIDRWEILKNYYDQ